MFNRLLVNLLSRWESFSRERAKWVTPRLTTAKWSMMEKSGSGRIIRLFMSLHQFSGISVRSHHHRKVEQWKCQWRCFYFSIRQDMHRVIQHEWGDDIYMSSLRGESFVVRIETVIWKYCQRISPSSPYDSPPARVLLYRIYSGVIYSCFVPMALLAFSDHKFPSFTRHIFVRT